MGNRETSRPTPARGAITLFMAVFVLPILFFLLTLSIDVRGYLQAELATQKVLDEAALYAWRFMGSESDGPNAAIAHAKKYLERYPDLFAHTSVEKEGDLLVLHYAGNSPLFFGRLAGMLTGSATPQGIPLHVTTRARGTVYDSVLAVDRSAYLAPSLGNPEARLWGSETDYPASPLFENAFPIAGIDARRATQACFNPFFSRFKEAALSTLEGLQAVSMNSTALVMFPGGYGPATTLKSLSRPMIAPQADFNETSEVIDESGQRTIDDEHVIRGGTIMSRYPVENRFCAAIAEDTDSPRGYWPPSRRLGTDPLGSHKRMILPGSWRYNEAYDPELTAADVLWTRAVRSDALPSTSAVLEHVLPVILGDPARSDRGGLKNRSVRNIVIFAGDLPREGTSRFGADGDSVVRTKLQAILAQYRQLVSAWNGKAGGDPLRLSIYYVLYQSPDAGITADSAAVASLASFFKSEALFEGMSPDNFRIQVLSGANPDGLERELLGRILLSSRSGVLSW